MADSDPDLAAQLLAAFSAPTGALPVPDAPSLSYEGWQWPSCDGADLSPEQKPEPNSESAPEQTSQEQSSQDPVPQAHSQPEAAIQEPLPQDHVRQESLPQETSQQEPSQQEPQQQEHLQRPATTPEPPPSPQKRVRSQSRSPTTDNHGSVAEKRLKTDHHDLEHRDVDLSAANWDISAMIQNALGSFDEQLNHPQSGHNQVAGDEPTPVISQTRPQAPRKVEQKRMKFSSNPYYVMRTMSLPLLGSLVRKTQRRKHDTLLSLTGHLRRPFKHYWHSHSSPEKRP